MEEGCRGLAEGRWDKPRGKRRAASTERDAEQAAEMSGAKGLREKQEEEPESCSGELAVLLTQITPSSRKAKAPVGRSEPTKQSLRPSTLDLLGRNHSCLAQESTVLTSALLSPP